jgi:extradiol dioxygenase family protein
LSEPFHLGIPVHDVEAAREFYGRVLGFAEGRRSEQSCVFNAYGNQFVVHHVEGYVGTPTARNNVDRVDVPVPHFGVILEVTAWQKLAVRLTGEVDFIIEPTVRYKGTTGEQHTMFFRDPSGNALEFKAFKNRDVGMFAPWDQEA